MPAVAGRQRKQTKETFVQCRTWTFSTEVGSASTKMPPPTMCMELPAYLPYHPAQHTHCILTWFYYHTGPTVLRNPPWMRAQHLLGRVTFLWSNYCGLNVLNLRANYIIFTLKCCDKELYNKGKQLWRQKSMQLCINYMHCGSHDNYAQNYQITPKNNYYAICTF